MAKPDTDLAVVAALSPIKVSSEKERTYYWCTCGRSKNQPWCDGSHAREGTSFKPKPTTGTGSDMYMCRCKQTKNPQGFCDGSHAKIAPEALGKPYDGATGTIGGGGGGGGADFTGGVDAHDLAVVAALSPAGVDSEESKTYYWCTCGRSKNQPFCDGSHAREGTSFKPKPTEGTGKKLYLCRCKQTKNPPFCDGSHAKLPAEALGKPFNPEATPKPAGGAGAGDIEDVGPARATASATKGAAGSAGDFRPTREEDTLAQVKTLAMEGLPSSHGEVTAMGVPRTTLPHWDDIQFVVGQLAIKPRLDDVAVATEVIIGPRARKPLKLNIPIFVSDMSYGALNARVKVALAKGAEMAGTGICSGEGGMLPEEKAANSRYFLEMGTAKWGITDETLKKAQAFHFKGGQGAKTGTGGHLTANKVTAKIAAVRGIPEGKDSVSPATFTDFATPADFKAYADHVRELTGGAPVGFKLSAQHIEQDIQFAVDASADYIILDGRGGGTGAAPVIFRDHISVPTIPALARARRYLDKIGASHVSLIITGGLRVPSDFAKALALGADAIAIANSALQSVGCIGARMCHTNMCPAGVATQDEELAKKIDIDVSAANLARFLNSSVDLMKILARACGHDSLSGFKLTDITTWKRDMADLAGVPYAGVFGAWTGRD